MSDNIVVIGKITGPWGIKGWVKLLSFTDPRDNISEYAHCLCKQGNEWKNIEFTTIRPQGKSIVGQISGIDDRDQALAFRGAELGVPIAELPALEQGEFYWHQLIGLTVVNEFTGERQVLGTVERMMATGANDVMVVAPNAQSIDAKERLIPWAPGVYVSDVDADAGVITVRWDAEF